MQIRSYPVYVFRPFSGIPGGGIFLLERDKTTALCFRTENGYIHLTGDKAFVFIPVYPSVELLKPGVIYEKSVPVIDGDSITLLWKPVNVGTAKEPGYMIVGKTEMSVIAFREDKDGNKTLVSFDVSNGKESNVMYEHNFSLSKWQLSMTNTFGDKIVLAELK